MKADRFNAATSGGMVLIAAMCHFAGHDDTGTIIFLLLAIWVRLMGTLHG